MLSQIMLRPACTVPRGCLSNHVVVALRVVTAQAVVPVAGPQSISFLETKFFLVHEMSPKSVIPVGLKYKPD